MSFPAPSSDPLTRESYVDWDELAGLDKIVTIYQVGTNTVVLETNEGREVRITAWLDRPYDDEKGPRRHITVVTSPNERGVLGLCTRLRDSAFKRSLAEMPVGADVDVEHPKGDFLLPEETDTPYVFIAGGIGITVFR